MFIYFIYFRARFVVVLLFVVDSSQHFFSVCMWNVNKINIRQSQIEKKFYIFREKKETWSALNIGDSDSNHLRFIGCYSIEINPSNFICALNMKFIKGKSDDGYKKKRANRLNECKTMVKRSNFFYNHSKCVKMLRLFKWIIKLSL